ncbi:hypothetical protein CR513_44010, partial [Mucuna pruriens]
MPAQGNSPSLENLMKQLVTSNLEFQQTMSSSNMQFQQNMNATIQDLKTQLQSAGSSNLPSQIVLNPRGNASALAKKCRDPGIFSIPCTIGDCTFADAMLDLGASINVMPTLIYKSLNFGDLEPTGMTIQLANRSVVQLLGVLEDVLVQFNIFEDMKHPTEDHSLFGIDLIDELLDSSSEGISNLAKDTESIGCLGFLTEEADYDEVWEVHNLSDSEDDNIDLADLSQRIELIKLLDQVCKYENPECSTKRSWPQQPKAETMLAHLVPNPIQVGQPDPKESNDNSSSPPPPMELKSLPSHLKYAYLDAEQQLFVIIASNLHWEQEDKLLSVLSNIRRKLGGSQTHKATKKKNESDHPRCGQERGDKNTGIIYPISDSQWVSPMQVVPKKFGMTVTKNHNDELVPIQIQNSWRVCIDYRRLNQATRKDHFPLSFIDQVLEKLVGKSHYCFLDSFSRYMQIHIALEDQHKTTFTYPFGTFAYTYMPFGLCNVPSTFQCCMTSIFSDLLQECMEVFMDDFTVYADHLVHAWRTYPRC